MTTMEDIINQRIQSLEGHFNWELYVRTRDIVLINYSSREPIRQEFLDRLTNLRVRLYEEREKL